MLFNLSPNKHRVMAVFLRMFAVGIAFAFNMLIARLFPEDVTGAILFAINSILMLAGVASLGLNNLIIANLSGCNEVSNFSIAFLVKMIFPGIMLLFPLSYFLASLHESVLQLDSLFFIYLFCGVLLLIQTHIAAFFIALGMQIRSIFFEVIIPVSLSSIGVVIYKDRGGEFILNVYMVSYLSSMVMSLIYLAILRNRENRKNKSIVFGVNDILGYGGLALTGAFISYYPVQLGGKNLSMSDVAALVIILKVSSIIRVVYTSIINLYLREMRLEFEKDNMYGFSIIIRRISKKLALVSAAFVVFVSLFGGYILSFFGDYYQRFHAELMVLVVGQCIFVALGAVGYALILTGKSSVLRNYSFVVTLTSAILGYYLSATYGIFGLSVSVAVMIASQHIVAAFLLYKIYNINVFSVARS
jgi:O-antigen/teichoic acid export membrane protein